MSELKLPKPSPRKPHARPERRRGACVCVCVCVYGVHVCVFVCKCLRVRDLAFIETLSVRSVRERERGVVECRSLLL